MSYQPIPDKTQVRADLIGARLARYELLEKIGDGRNGAVYRARHLDTGQEAAIKVTREAIAERDVRAASALEHAGIAKIFDLGRLPDGRHYVAMELMQGEGLDWAMHRFGTMLVPDVVRVLCAVAEALEAAHERSLVHGALKPSSVFLVRLPDDGFRVKLLDFGMSPPEGGPEPSVASDLRALGMLGYTMLTGKLEVPARLPRPIAPVLPLTLEELIVDLVEAASKLRPKTAAEVRVKLEPLRPLPPAPEPTAPSPEQQPPPAPPPPKPRPLLALLFAPVLCLLTAAVAFLAWPTASAPEPPVIAAPPPPAEVTTVTPIPERPDERPPDVRPKAPKAKPIPTEERLEDRMSRLEARLRKRPGAHTDALHTLSKLRLRLSGMPDVEDRKDVAKQLDAWEQTHLGKSHW